MPNPDSLDCSKIRNRLASVNLPAVPSILVKLMELCQNNESSLVDLGNLIACDTALTAKILGRANSSLYKGKRNANLMQSVQILGMDMIKLICISESVYQVFGDFKHINELVFQKLWIHSLLTAISARLIAKGMNYPNSEEAYLAGLLHDVGRLALLSAEPSVSEFLSQDDEALCKLERRLFQFTHAEASAWILAQWNFDSFLSDSVLYHHEDAGRIKKSHPLIRIVFLAEILAHHIKEKSPMPSDLVSILGGGGGYFNLEAVIKDTADQIRQAFDALGIDDDEIADSEKNSPASGNKLSASSQSKKDITQLSNKLRNYVLIAESETFLSKQQTKVDVYPALLQLTCWIFNFEDAILFLTDESKNHLKAVPVDTNQQFLKDLFIPLNDLSHAATKALLKNFPVFLDHEDTQLEIIEEQLQRILGGKCLVFLPLCDKSEKIGVVIGRIDEKRLEHLRMRSLFLREYGERIAYSLNLEAYDSGHTLPQANEGSIELQEKTRRLFHEINNPLTIIKNYLNVLKNKADKNEYIGSELLILNEEIDRVSVLINSLYQSQSKPGLVLQVTDINKTVNEMVKLFRDSGFVPSTVELVVQQSDHLLEIECSQHVFKQILMNLLKNSIEALSAGGKIEISCKDFINLDGQKYIGLIVADNGHGINDEMMSKMFTSAQSTKDEKHRGLGLSIVYDLVSKANGHISCRSSALGTSFEVLFPLHASVLEADRMRK